MAEVRWTRQARADLTAIGEYLARSSPGYARIVVGRLFAAAEVLADHPALGRIIPETAVEHVRELVREGYRIVCLLDGEQVEILTVLHSRQDLRRKLRRE